MNNATLRRKLFEVALIVVAGSFLVEWISPPYDWHRAALRAINQVIGVLCSYVILRDPTRRSGRTRAAADATRRSLTRLRRVFRVSAGGGRG